MRKNYKELLEKDKMYIWHPYTQMKDYENDYHILIKSAKKFKLYDSENRYYYDTISSWWCNILGHNIKEINAAIIQQLENFEHTLFAGFTNEQAIELAEKLIKLVNSDEIDKVFFSDNGSTAVEVALKMSCQYWSNYGKPEKTKFIYLENSYHGDTIGTMSVSGTAQFFKYYKKICVENYSIPSPYCYRCNSSKSCKYQCLEPLKKILNDNHNKISGLIIEPLVQCAGGMIVYPAEYLNKLYEIIKYYEIHLILDEIAVGFGRTGKMFAFHYSDAIPDFICLSKAITNGTLPLGVTLTTNQIYDAFYDDYSKNKTFFHGHTFTGNPLSAAAANATIDLLISNNLIEKSQAQIKYLNNEIYSRFNNFQYIGDIRNIGFIAAFEIVKDKSAKEKFDSSLRIGRRIYFEGLKNNLILRPLDNIIYLFLPITITKRDIDIILNKLEVVLKNVISS